jgi:uncharacterized protein (TIGR03435 family)
MRPSIIGALFVSAFVVASAIAAHAQSSTAAVPEPTFDVVSIKPNVTGAGGFSTSGRPGGGFAMTNGTLSMLIAQGYTGQEQVIGLPDWATSTRYDVIATGASAIQTPTPDQRRAMSRALLADRFKFAAHYETREVPAFDLVLARSDGKFGPSLVPSDIDCVAYGAAQRAAAEAARAAGAPPPPPRPFSMTDPLPPCSQRSSGSTAGRRFEGHMTLASVASMVRSTAGRFVVDKTGLTGYYNVRLEHATGTAVGGSDTVAAAGELPNIFTALQEQLGLKLEPSRATVQVLVIDHVEPPTEN